MQTNRLNLLWFKDLLSFITNIKTTVLWLNKDNKWPCKTTMTYAILSNKMLVDCSKIIWNLFRFLLVTRELLPKPFLNSKSYSIKTLLWPIREVGRIRLWGTNIKSLSMLQLKCLLNLQKPHRKLSQTIWAETLIQSRSTRHSNYYRTMFANPTVLTSNSSMALQESWKKM